VARPEKHRVLCVDDDRDVAELVQAILVDEGYEVTCLYDVAVEALQRVIGQFEPDCVLLDGTSDVGFGAGWESAAWMRERRRPVPVVMFTAHIGDAREATENLSERARAAAFSAVLTKPFSLDELLETVARAVGRSEPFLHTDEADAARTAELVESLVRAGARDIARSDRREWATFRNRRDQLIQLYWWQRQGVYQVGRYTEGGRLRMIGQFVDRDTAIGVALL
jgi:CheY-like chemotaxis protein